MALRWRGCSGNGHRRGVGRKYQSGIFPFPTQSGKPQDKADEGRSAAIPPPRRQMTPNGLPTGKLEIVFKNQNEVLLPQRAFFPDEIQQFAVGFTLPEYRFVANEEELFAGAGQGHVEFAVHHLSVFCGHGL